MVTKKAIVFISRDSYVGICSIKCSMNRSEEPKCCQSVPYSLSA